MVEREMKYMHNVYILCNTKYTYIALLYKFYNKNKNIKAMHCKSGVNIITDIFVVFSKHYNSYILYF